MKDNISENTFDLYEKLCREQYLRKTKDDEIMSKIEKMEPVFEKSENIQKIIKHLYKEFESVRINSDTAKKMLEQFENDIETNKLMTSKIVNSNEKISLMIDNVEKEHLEDKNLVLNNREKLNTVIGFIDNMKKDLELNTSSIKSNSVQVQKTLEKFDTNNHEFEMIKAKSENTDLNLANLKTYISKMEKIILDVKENEDKRNNQVDLINNKIDSVVSDQLALSNIIKKVNLDIETNQSKMIELENSITANKNNVNTLSTTMTQTMNQIAKNLEDINNNRADIDKLFKKISILNRTVYRRNRTMSGSDSDSN